MYPVNVSSKRTRGFLGFSSARTLLRRSTSWIEWVDLLLFVLVNGGACIDGTLLSPGVRGCLGGLDPAWKDEVELLNPLDKNESNLTGEFGRNDFDLSPSASIAIDLRILEWNATNGVVRAGLLMWFCDRSKSFTAIVSQMSNTIRWKAYLALQKWARNAQLPLHQQKLCHEDHRLRVCMSVHLEGR